MSVTKDGDTGRWMSQIRVTDWTGKTIHKKKRGFATKKEALQWERDFISQSTGSLGMTFGDFISLYVKDISLPVQSEPEEDGLSMEQLSSGDDTLDKLLEEQDICMLLQNCKRQYTGTARLGIEAIEWKVKGLSGAEIAKMYGVKPNLVGAWISRAAGRLKQNRDFMQYFDRSVEIDSS